MTMPDCGVYSGFKVQSSKFRESWNLSVSVLSASPLDDVRAFVIQAEALAQASLTLSLTPRIARQPESYFRD